MNMHRVIQAVLILAAALQQSASAITAPLTGQTLSAQVPIRGTIEGGNFAFAEIAFGYVLDPTDTWFLIQLIPQLPGDEVLAVWDITSLTDGDYRLRLRVYATDGSFQDAYVNDLHLRNEPTATAIPTQEAIVATATLEARPTVEMEATELPPLILDATSTAIMTTPPPLPPNPAALTPALVYSILGRGALLVLILFTVLGLFLRLRRS
jgi:hypothetical protein